MGFIRCSQRKQDEVRNRVLENFGKVGLAMFEDRLSGWLCRRESPVRYSEFLDIEKMVIYEMQTLPERRELDRELQEALKRFNELQQAMERRAKNEKQREKYVRKIG